MELKKFTEEEYKALLMEYAKAMDKQNWPDGEWKTEPDEEYFEYEGYKCRVMRAETSGSLCGYGALPKEDEYYGKEYDDIPLDVHGGITYGRIEKDDYHWVGFDCAHMTDFSPKFDIVRKFEETLFEFSKKYPDADLWWLKDRTYKNIEFVRTEIRHMVDQLKARDANGIQQKQ